MRVKLVPLVGKCRIWHIVNLRAKTILLDFFIGSKNMNKPVV